MGWAQERWAASPHCRQSLTVGHQWSCAVSCLGEPCPEPTWQGCLLSTAISPPWFLELWGAEPLRGPGEELGTPSPLGVLGGVSVVQGPALWADPQAISACIPLEPKPGIILESPLACRASTRARHHWCPQTGLSNSLGFFFPSISHVCPFLTQMSSLSKHLLIFPENMQ